MATKAIETAANIPANVPQIYGLIGQAIRKVGAIGKDGEARNASGKKMYNFRGIDAVYNALNPVFAELGIFIVPEVIEQTREERQTTNGGNLIYSILKIRFTFYAPDGSNVSAVVIGEGMDSGDKASNKAMSVGFKYAAFELLCIPTEEMVDPDAETHEVAPRNRQTPPQNRQTPPPEPKSDVTNVPNVPPTPSALENKVNSVSENPVLTFLAKERNQLAEVRQLDKAENAALWNKQVDVLKKAGEIPNKPLSTFTQDEAAEMVRKMYDRFDPTGTELKAAAK